MSWEGSKSRKPFVVDSADEDEDDVVVLVDSVVVVVVVVVVAAVGSGRQIPPRNGKWRVQ